MKDTGQFSSSAMTRSAKYIDILQQTFELIMNDSILNGYELAGISDYAQNLCTQLTDRARKRKDRLNNV